MQVVCFVAHLLKHLCDSKTLGEKLKTTFQAAFEGNNGVSLLPGAPKSINLTGNQ